MTMITTLFIYPKGNYLHIILMISIPKQGTNLEPNATQITHTIAPKQQMHNR